MLMLEGHEPTGVGGVILDVLPHPARGLQDHAHPTPLLQGGARVAALGAGEVERRGELGAPVTPDPITLLDSSNDPVERVLLGDHHAPEDGLTLGDPSSLDLLDPAVEPVVHVGG